jgi:hypothetical protein
MRQKRAQNKRWKKQVMKITSFSTSFSSEVLPYLFVFSCLGCASQNLQPVPKTYSGYGAESTNQATLAKYAPEPLPPDIASRIQSLLDIRAPRVPVGEAIQIHEALQARKIPSRLIIFPDEGHGASRRVDQVLEMGHLIRFFKENLIGTTGT